MRALETGRPLLRVANTGVTAAIGVRGEVLSRLAVHVDGTLVGTVQPVVGTTPYARVGDALAMALCGLGVVPLAFAALRRRAPAAHTTAA